MLRLLRTTKGKIITFFALVLFATGIFFFNSKLQSDIFNTEKTEGIFLTINNTGSIYVGDTINVNINVRSPREISKVVTSLYYDPLVLQYRGSKENTEKYTSLLLSKSNIESGWLYFADGRSDFKSPPQDETFMTLEFVAIKPGATKLSLDPEISKFAIGADYDNSPLRVGYTTLPNNLQEILPPEIEVVLNKGVPYTSSTTVPYTISVKKVGAENKITEYKVQEVIDDNISLWGKFSSRVLTDISQDLKLDSTIEGKRKVAFAVQDIFGNWYYGDTTKGDNPMVKNLTLDTTPPRISNPIIMTLNEKGEKISTTLTNRKDILISWKIPEDDAPTITSQSLIVKSNGKIIDTLSLNKIDREKTLVLQDGTYTTEISVKDYLGRESKTSSDIFTIDTLPPLVYASPLELLIKNISPFTFTLLPKNLLENGSGLDLALIQITKKGESIPIEDKIFKIGSGSTLGTGSNLSMDKLLQNGDYDVNIKVADKAGNWSLSMNAIKGVQLLIVKEDTSLVKIEKVILSTGSTLDQIVQDLKINVAKETIVTPTDVKTKIGSGTSTILSPIVNNTLSTIATSKVPITGSTIPEGFIVPATKNIAVTVNTVVPYATGGGSSGGGGGSGSGNTSSNPLQRISIDTLKGSSAKGITLTPSTTSTVSDVINKQLEKIPVFVDIPQTHWASSYISALAAKGVISGYSDKSFQPDRQVTRAELLKMVIIAGKTDIVSQKNTQFKDVSTTSWYLPYVNTAVQKGIVGGYKDGTFKPNSPITRAEALKILYIANGNTLSKDIVQFKDVKPTDWYTPYVSTAALQGVVKGYADQNFRPNAPITRAEAAKILTLIIK